MLLMFLGAAYGLVLSVLSVASAGVGHGSYIPAGVSSSPIGAVAVLARTLGAAPIGLLTSAAPALFGAPVLWAAMGWLLGRSSSPKGRVWFLLAVTCHYVVGLGLMFSEEFGGWSYVVRLHRAAPWILPLWAMVYVGGQAAMWIRYRSGS